MGATNIITSNRAKGAFSGIKNTFKNNIWNNLSNDTKDFYRQNADVGAFLGVTTIGGALTGAYTSRNSK